MKKQTPSRKAPNLTSLFLAKDKRQQLCTLLKDVKTLYKSYDKEDVKRSRLKTFAEDMWNSLQDEFFHTADITDNSIWKWQDKLAIFDEQGYLYEIRPSDLSDWAQLVKGWYNREWAVEVLKLVQEFNLDNQKPEYVRAFKSDFKAVQNEQQFVSAVYKWSDLILWSPWKLSLLDNTFEQPRNVHYEDDFNPDMEDSDEYYVDL